MRKAISVFLVCVIGLSIPIGAYTWIQTNVGDLGNLDVIAYYVPWIFHLMLWQFAFFVWLGLMLMVVVSGEEPEAPKTSLRAESKVEAAEEEKVIPEPKKAAPKKKKPKKKKPPQKKKERKKPAAQEKTSPGKKEPEKPEPPAAWQEEEFE